MAHISGLADTIKWYDANAAQYAAATAPNADVEMLDRFSAVLPEGSPVLDAGCGAGRDTKLLSDRKMAAVGLDLSQGLLAVARESFPDLHFVQGSFLALPFADGQFAGVWAHAALVHLETVAAVEQSLAEFNRVLKPDGLLYVFVKQQLGAEKTGVVSDALSGHDRFFQWFTKDELSTLLKTAGFVIQEITDSIPDPTGRAEVQWIRALARKKTTPRK